MSSCHKNRHYAQVIHIQLHWKKNVNFENADLRGVNLTNADLIGADFTGANLSGAILGDNITQAQIDSAVPTSNLSLIHI